MIAGLSVSVPLFDQNSGEIDRATADRLAAEREFAWIERVVVAEVIGAYEVARRLSARVADLQRTFLSRAEESSRITAAAYQEGGATLLQVLDASRTLAAARLSYSRAVFAQRESLFELKIAAGYDPTAPITDPARKRRFRGLLAREVSDDVPAVFIASAIAAVCEPDDARCGDELRTGGTARGLRRTACRHTR